MGHFYGAPCRIWQPCGLLRPADIGESNLPLAPSRTPVGSVDPGSSDTVAKASSYLQLKRLLVIFVQVFIRNQATVGITFLYSGKLALLHAIINTYECLRVVG